MLNKHQADILAFVEANGTADSDALADKFGQDAVVVAELMCERQLLDRLYMNQGYRLQAKGRQQLAEYRMSAKDDLQERTAQKADEERKYHRQRLDADQDREKQFRHDWRVTVVTAVISFVSGLIVAHFVDIAGYCAFLLRSALEYLH